MDDMKAEYDAALSENKTFLLMRRDFHHRFEEQLSELEHVDRSLADLEAAHMKYKSEAEGEIARLKAQLAHQPQSVPPDSTDNNNPTNRPNGIPTSLPSSSNAAPVPRSNPFTSQDPVRSLPPRLPAPLASSPLASAPLASAPHPVAELPQPSHAPSLQQQPHLQHQPPYHSSLQSFGTTSRQMYQPSHPPLPNHLNPYSQYPQPHADQLQHHSKFPRLVGGGVPHPHHLQLPHSATVPLPSLTGAAPGGIPSMMSNGAPSVSRGDVPPMGLMGNGGHDDRFKGQGGRGMPIRGGNNTMSRRSTGSGTAGRGRHGSMSNAEDGVRMTQNDDDWDVVKGRRTDGSTVAMNLRLQDTLLHDSVVCCVRYSWDGSYLATGSNRSAHIFDASNGRQVAKFMDSKVADDEEGGGGSDSYVRAVCFSPSGDWLVTGAEDHVVKVWDVRTRQVKHKLVGHSTDIYSVDASANSRFIISGSGDKKAKLWNLENGTLLSTLGDDVGPTDGITSVSVSPTSQHVAAGSLDKIVRVWDVETSHLVRQFEGHKDSVYSVAFSPDGRMLLSGSLDKTLKLWDLAASQQSAQCRLTFTGHKDFVLSVAFSPNARWLISGSKDRTVQFWDLRQSTMCLTLQGHKNSVISIAHNPTSNQLATGSGDCRARMWLYDYQS